MHTSAEEQRDEHTSAYAYRSRCASQSLLAPVMLLPLLPLLPHIYSSMR
jgi:hypothetical protein